ncbi:hypothetical protein AMTRI_Chr11g94010 [Amborella trichopoda]
MDDRLSSLSDDILHRILSPLPIRETGRTSVLSKRWRHVWASVPVFNTKGINRPSIIDQALLLHNGPIHQASLQALLLHNAPSYRASLPLDKLEPGNVDRWMLSLTRRGLQDLTIEIEKEPRYKIHSSIFFCDALMSLNLKHCILKPPADFKGFPSLERLSLEKVSLLDDTILESLVSKSRQLKYLKLSECSGLSSVKIHALNVISFHFNGFFNSLNLDQISNLKNLFLRCAHAEGNVGDCRASKLLKDLHKLESITLLGWSMWVLFSGDVPASILSTTHCSLRTLDICLNMRENNEVKGFFYLLRSYPSLEKLSLLLDGKTEPINEIDGTCLSELRTSKSDWLGCLKIVNVKDLSDLEEDMELIRFLLSNAIVLDKLTIEYEKEVNQVEQLKIAKRLAVFPRSSAGAMMFIE